MGVRGPACVCSYGRMVLLGMKTSEDTSCWLLSSCGHEFAVELTREACAGDRREYRSAEGARPRAICCLGVQQPTKVVQGGPVTRSLFPAETTFIVPSACCCC